MHRSLMILATILVLGGCAGLGQGPGPEDTARRDTLIAAVSNAAVGDRLDLREVLGDDWDQIGFLGPYARNDIASTVLGFGFDYEAVSPWLNTEGGTVVVLAHNRAAVSWFAMPSDQVGLYCLERVDKAVAAADAIFAVAEDDGGNRDLVLVPRPEWC